MTDETPGGEIPVTAPFAWSSAVEAALAEAGIDPADVDVVVEGGGPDVRILLNDNVPMSPKKMAAQAVHAALSAFGVDHGRVVVLGGRPGQIKKMPHQIRDAGVTELRPGTLTAGAELED